MRYPSIAPRTADRPTIIALPERLDVHQVDRLTGMVSMACDRLGRPEVLLDGSCVAHMDQAGAGLLGWITATCQASAVPVYITNASLALVLGIELNNISNAPERLVEDYLVDLEFAA